LFVSILTYNREISRQEPLFEAHRAFVETQIERGAFLCSGPRLDALGGLIVVYGDDQEVTRELLDGDPFVAQGIADYELYPFRIGLADPASSLATGDRAR